MTLEQQAIHIITALPADKLSQLVTYAQFLLAQPEVAAISDQKNTNEEKNVRQPGILKGQIRMDSDFDETPECFKEYVSCI